MYVAIFNDISKIEAEIRQITDKRIKPSLLLDIGHKIDKGAKLIQEKWYSFSESDREELKNIAYRLLENPQGLKALWMYFWGIIYMLFIKITGQEEAFHYCIDALDRLVDNILDAVERENSNYQQTLVDTLEELKSNPEIGEVLDESIRYGWIREVSDKAVAEI